MKYLVTAGPTREPIDPVRFIGNRSSGKMGFGIARAAVEAGHEVRLISGPVSIPVPEAIPVTQVETAAEMLEAVRANLLWCDVLVMVAAVADWKPAKMAPHKIKKHDGPAVIALERTKDILATIKPEKGHRIFVGFAAETENVLEEAFSKCRSKGLDLIVANDVTAPDAGFEVDTNRVTLIYADGRTERLPLMAKVDVAQRIVHDVSALKAALNS